MSSAYKEIVGYFVEKIGKCFESLEFPFKSNKTSSYSFVKIYTGCPKKQLKALIDVSFQI